MSISPIIIALSGGGFRATLYHCGVMRALQMSQLNNNNSHYLSQPYISSVSGGCVCGAVWDYFYWTSREDDFLDQPWPEEWIIKLVDTGFQGFSANRIPLLFTGYRSKKWYEIISTWWKLLSEDRENWHGYLGGQVHSNRHVIELLDENTGLVHFATNEKIFTDINYKGYSFSADTFDFMKYYLNVENVQFDYSDIPNLIVASTAFKGYFKSINIKESSFFDAGLIDNRAYLGAHFLYNSLKLDVKDRNYDITPKLFFSDAGEPFRYKKNDNLILYGVSRKKVKKFSLKNQILRLGSSISQQNFQPIILNYFDNLFSSIDGCRITIKLDDPIWYPTKTLPTAENIINFETSVKKITPHDAIAIMAYGAQTMATLLPKEKQALLKKFYFDMLKNY